MDDPWSGDPWEGSHDRAGFASDDELENDDAWYNAVSADDAADYLAHFVVSLKRGSKPFTATDACTIAFWATKAGMKGFINDFAANPVDVKHHSRKFDDAVSKNFVDSPIEKYHVTFPSYRRSASVRCEEVVPMHLPLDCLRADLAKNHDMPARLDEALANGKLPVDRYLSHPVVGSAAPGVAVYPYSLYFDGIPFTRNDGLLAVYLTNLVTNEIHLLIILRKSEMCECGCKHWCTLYVLLLVLDWAFRHCSPLAVEPGARHDQTDWHDDEP